jgi:hypothetical protein
MKTTTNGTHDIALETQLQILRQERQMWLNTRYLAEVRLRVQRRIESGPEAEAAQIKELERCERAIDALDEELRAIG